MFTKYLRESNLKIDIPKKSFPIPWTSPCLTTPPECHGISESRPQVSPKNVSNMMDLLPPNCMDFLQTKIKAKSDPHTSGILGILTGLQISQQDAFGRVRH